MIVGGARFSVVEISQISYVKGSTSRFGNITIGFSSPVYYVLHVLLVKTSRVGIFAQMGVQNAGYLMFQHLLSRLDSSCSVDSQAHNLPAIKDRLNAIHDHLMFVKDTTILGAVMECCRVKMEVESLAAACQAFVVIPEYDSKAQQDLVGHFGRPLVYIKYLKERLPLVAGKMAEPLLKLIGQELALLSKMAIWTVEFEKCTSFNMHIKLNPAETIREELHNI